MRILLLSILVSLSFATACKPAGEDATLMSVSGKKAVLDTKTDAKDAKQVTATIPDTSVDKPPATVEDDGVLWKLSGFWKVEEGKVQKLGPKMFVDTGAIFFSSKSTPRTSAQVNAKLEAAQKPDWDAITPAEAKKAGATGIDTPAKKSAFRTTLANLRKKEKIRVATNLEIGTDNLLITSKYWINVYILGKRMFIKGAKTFELVAKAGIGSDSATQMMKPTASVTGTAFGQTVLAHEVTTAKGFKYAAPIPPLLDAAIPVYGLPALQIVVKLGITVRAELLFNLTARKIGSATLTMSPTIGVDMFVGPGAQIGPATATIEAKLMVFQTAWPVSATVGGSKTPAMFWGGITYDGQEIKSLKGAILIKLALAPPLVLKPFFFAVKLLAPFIGITVSTTSWAWEHEIWAAKEAWILKKGTGYTGPSYLKVLKKDAATCKAVDDKITAHIADVKGPVPTADKNYVEVKTSIEKMLLAIKAKKCP